MPVTRPFVLVLLFVLGTALAGDERVPITRFLEAASPEPEVAQPALDAIASDWRPGYAAILIDLARLMPAPAPAPRRSSSAGSFDAESPGGPGSAGRGGPSREGGAMLRESGLSSVSAGPAPVRGGSPVRERLVRFLGKQSGKRYGHDLDRWRGWLWRQPYAPHPDYAWFKNGLYARIDPAMGEFFTNGPATVRLDHIDWGGVAIGGIPELVDPEVVAAADATHMQDEQVVFGVAVDGAARAYPERILAWHELARDRLGQVDVTLVYCTLCGTVIPYDSRVGDRRFTFRTSGLLYRSNKLMFDLETKTLWNSLYGRPVVGPLAESGIELDPLPVVTTSWGEWKRLHPDSTVLVEPSIGGGRDYGEGVAYRDYFGDDELMFTVPGERDRRLRNKDEVFVIPELARDGAPLAISKGLLNKRRIYAIDDLVVLTSEDGASRAYRAGGVELVEWIDARTLRDATGSSWQLTESRLSSGARELDRVSGHEVFWFAWYAQFPGTRLVKR